MNGTDSRTEKTENMESLCKNYGNITKALKLYHSHIFIKMGKDILKILLIKLFLASASQIFILDARQDR